MKKLSVFFLEVAFVSALVLVGIIVIAASGSDLESPENLLYTHSLTKAICNSENFCQDYEIFCEKEEVIKMSPTGAAIQFSEIWKDPRGEEIRSRLC